MDIQKEFKDYALSKGWCIDGESTKSGYLFYNAQTNDRWIGWQAAKSKALPEGIEIGRLQDRITELLDERQELYAQINKGVAEKIELIIRDVAELPDRTSPEDWPEALIVTSGELEEILTQHLSEKCRNQEQGE